MILLAAPIDAQKHLLSEILGLLGIADEMVHHRHEAMMVLLDELGRYEPELLERPRVVVGNKSDSAAYEFDGLCISAAAHQNLDALLGKLAQLVGEARRAEPDEEAFVVLRPEEQGFSVKRDDDGAWRVTGRSAERVVAVADLTNLEAIGYVQDRLRRMGVERALARAGAREGDVVRIGPVELEYQESLA
jgi:GTP-binding protein